MLITLKRVISLLFLFLVAAGTSFGQNVAPAASDAFETVDGYFYWSAKTVAIKTGYVTVGTRYQGHISNLQAYLFEFNMNHQIVRQKTLNIFRPNAALDISGIGDGFAKTPDGGYAMTTIDYTVSPQQSDAGIIKLDSLFNIEWIRYYGIPSVNESLGAISVTSDGKIGIVGSTSNNKMLLVQYDLNGNLVWGREIVELSGSGYGSDIKSTANGWMVVYRNAVAANSKIVYFNYSGTLTGQTTSPCGCPVTRPSAVAESATNNGYVSVGQQSSHFMAMRIDNTGTAVVQKQFVVGSMSSLRGIESTFDSGFIAFGVNSSYDKMAYVVRISEQADTLWTKGIGDTTGGYDYAVTNAIQLMDSSYGVVMLKQNFNNHTSQLYVANIAAEVMQTVTLTAQITGNGTITPSGTVTVLKGGNQEYTIIPSDGYEVEDVKVGGISQGAITSYMFSNVQKNDTISVSFVLKTGISTMIKKDGGAYPNPTTGLITFSGVDQTDSYIGTFFDLTGREVKTSVLPAGNASVDLTDLPQGAYLYRLRGAHTKGYYLGRIIITK